MNRYFLLDALSTHDGEPTVVTIGSYQTLSQVKRAMLAHQTFDVFHVWTYSLRGFTDYGEPFYRGTCSTWETDQGKVVRL